MSARVLKWSVPVDDRPHKIGTGPVLHVACQLNARSVEVWTIELPDAVPYRPVQAFGTGQPLPDGWAPIGSALAADGLLVWHLFGAPSEEWGADA